MRAPPSLSLSPLIVNQNASAAAASQPQSRCRASPVPGGMMERVETRPADVRYSGLLPLEPNMEAYSAGSRKNLKNDEEKPHAAGSKTEKNDEEKPHAAGSKTKKKRKEVLNKDDEKEPHAKKKKPLLPDLTLEELLQVKGEPELEEPGLKLKTVKLKLTTVELKHFEEYTPIPPYRPSHFLIKDPRMLIALERADARYQARLERRKRAVQQIKDKGFAELEFKLLDDHQECNELADIEKFLDDPEV